jgi:hypothetical protein
MNPLDTNGPMPQGMEIIVDNATPPNIDRNLTYHKLWKAYSCNKGTTPPNIDSA